MLRLELVLDGELVVHCRPVIGYLHTGIEKTFEAKTYVQGVDKIVTVDVYVPGCPPTPDALLDSLIKLKQRVAANSRGARHGAQTTAGVGIAHDGTTP